MRKGKFSRRSERPRMPQADEDAIAYPRPFGGLGESHLGAAGGPGHLRLASQEAEVERAVLPGNRTANGSLGMAGHSWAP